MAAGFMKPPADAQAAAKGAAKGRKAAKRQGAASGPGFRTYTAPGGLQVLHDIFNENLGHSP